jgi:tetratricopeptide (TPR) repeat protein
LHLDQCEPALAAFHRANEIRPHAAAFTNLGTVLFSLERYEECVAAFEKAVALNPSDPWSWGNLGNACRHLPERRARMREALERAVGLMRERLDRGPGDGDAWGRLAGWLANLERNDEARQALGRALETAADDVHCMVRAGHTFLQLGSRDDAIHWLRRAVESGYGVDVLRRDPELRALTGDAEFERILATGSRLRVVGDVGEVREGRPS